MHKDNQKEVTIIKLGHAMAYPCSYHIKILILEAAGIKSRVYNIVID
jgi:hypothetical protein